MKPTARVKIKMQDEKRITVVYQAIDGYSKTGSFTSLESARRFARQWVGEHPEFGSDYAVSADGVGKVMVYGVSLRTLFPEAAP